jgi:MFS family permease
VLLCCWVVHERNAADPLIDVRMLGLPVIWRTNMIAFMLGVSLYSVFVVVPQVVQAPPSTGYGLGGSPAESGLTVLPMTITMFIAGLMSGRLTDRLGAKSLLVLGSGVCVPAYVLLAYLTPTTWLLGISTACIGVGLGTLFAVTATNVLTEVPSSQAAVASAMTANIRLVGGALGLAAISATLAAHTVIGWPSQHGYRTVFLELAGASALGLLAASLVPANPSPPDGRHSRRSDSSTPRGQIN